MNYPNKLKKEYHKVINYANRGMDLESIINDTNRYLLEKDIAVIYKKPTPIGIVDVSYKNNKQIITKAYFSSESTLDYNGIYKGKYIEFDAKSTKSSTSFPLANIHKHQLEHIKSIIRHNGIVFLIISMNNEFILLNGIDLISFINNNKRKSIPFAYLKKYGYILEYNYIKGLNYIDIINIIGGINNEKNIKEEKY